MALVIIDPISSYMGKTDSHKNSEVRGAFEPAGEMAERLRVAILSITHFSKAGAGNSAKALQAECFSPSARHPTLWDEHFNFIDSGELST